MKKGLLFLGVTILVLGVLALLFSGLCYILLHGTSDEVINPSSSTHAYKKIPAQKKRLIYIEGAKHRMLYDGRMEQTVFTLIEQMLENKIF